MESKCFVSVIMITYGHEKFIRKSISGVLMQSCDFKVELIVANDCSPDNTDLIVEEIISKNVTDITVKYIKHDKNRGMVQNFIYALDKCEGKYIALCDGDDYWIDSLKLQKQVDFLELNSRYFIHSGRAQTLKSNKLKDIIERPLKKSIYDATDFLTKNNIISCTVLFRNIHIENCYFKDLIFLDWMLYFLLLSNREGNLAYDSDELFSVYRIHDGGVMKTIATKTKNNKAHLRQIMTIKKNSNFSYAESDIVKINSYCASIFRNALRKNNLKECFTSIQSILLLTTFKDQYRFLKNRINL